MTWARLPIAARIAVSAGLLAAVLLSAGAFAVRGALHASQMQSTQQLAGVEATQITDATRAGILLSGSFGALPYRLVRSDGAMVAADPEAESATVPLPSVESSQTNGEVWDVDRTSALGATVAVSSTLRASSMTDIAADELPGGPADKDTTVYRAYVFVTPTAADRVVAALDPFLWTGVALVVALITMTAAVATRRALRPVEQLRAAAAGIAGSPDGARLVEPHTRDELHALTLTLNAMLRRIDDASTRQKRFTADAAHELRTPLASLLAALDVAHAHPEAVPPERTLAHVETEARRLAALAEELLDLAAADGARTDDTATCDAARAVRAVVLDRPATLPVAITAPGSAAVRIAPGPLARVIENLLANAARHASALIEIEVHVDDAVRIDVSNDGEPLSPADAERIFEPFVRLDSSRSRDTGGTGLGLSIARELVARSGGTLTAASTPTRTTFSITLPRALSHA